MYAHTKKCIFTHKKTKTLDAFLFGVFSKILVQPVSVTQGTSRLYMFSRRNKSNVYTYTLT